MAVAVGIIVIIVNNGASHFGLLAGELLGLAPGGAPYVQLETVSLHYGGP